MAESSIECNSNIDVDPKCDPDKNENSMEVEISAKENNAKCEMMNIEGGRSIEKETLENTDIVNDVGKDKVVQENIRSIDHTSKSIDSVIKNSDSSFKSVGNAISLDVITNTDNQGDVSDSDNQNDDLKEGMLVNMNLLSKQTSVEDLFLKSNKSDVNIDSKVKLVQSSGTNICVKGIIDNVDAEEGSKAKEVDEYKNSDIKPAILEDNNIGLDLLESFQTVTKNRIGENSKEKNISSIASEKTEIIDHEYQSLEATNIGDSDIDNKEEIVHVSSTKFEAVHVKSEFFTEEENNIDDVDKREILNDTNFKKSQICYDIITENSDASKVQSEEGEHSCDSFRKTECNSKSCEKEKKIDGFKNDKEGVSDINTMKFETVEVKSEFNTDIIDGNEIDKIEIDENLGHFQDFGDGNDKNSYESKMESEEAKTPVILEVKSIAPEMLPSFHNDTDERREKNDEVNKSRFDCVSLKETEYKVPNSRSYEVQKVSGLEKDKEELFANETMKLGTVHIKSEFSTDIVDEKTEEKMEIEDNSDNTRDFGYGNIEDFNDSKIKLEVESKEAEDFIVIEHCTSGIKNSSDKSFIKEGSAEILLSLPKVFYNPVQEFNRDMSIAALIVFAEDHQTDPRFKNRGVKRKNISEGESSDEKKNTSSYLKASAGTKVDNGITILEALSATGLRSIRYAKEIPGVKQVIANDISEVAVKEIKKNAEHNSVGDIIVTSRSDASLLMHQQIADDKLFDVVDLDPYGCPSRFLDAAVQAVRDGGILLVTCTDMAVLAGNSPETCHAKYGAVSLRNNACHEMAIRLALQCIESHANRYGRYIVPLLSFSADFYIRIIVQVYTSPVTCKKTTSKLSMVYQCVGCQALTLSPLGLATQIGTNQMKFTLPHSPPVNMTCSHCFYQHVVGGPIWSAPIHKISFVERMLSIIEGFQFATSKRMEGMLEVIKEELPDVPLYYTISGLCSKIHCQVVPIIDFRSALLNAGYRVSLSHASPNSIKTNAPVKTLWDIIRCWVQLNPISKRRLVDGSVSAAILFQEPTLIANFEFHPKAKPNSRIRGLLRFQQNPQRNWGPGTRSRVNIGDNLDDRRRTNQNKKSKNTPVEIIEVITL